MWTEAVGPITLPTSWGDVKAFGFSDFSSNSTHVAILIDDYKRDDVLTRVQSACLFGHVFFGLDCDCRSQLDASMQTMVRAGGGIVIYLAQEGRGIGLHKKIMAMKLQEELNVDTVDAYAKLGLASDHRDYGDAVTILQFLNIRTVRLLTNSPHKKNAFIEGGITVTQAIALEIPLTSHNRRELFAKRSKLGHELKLIDPDPLQ